jgi:DNA-binding transcriptional MerR regulator
MKKGLRLGDVCKQLDLQPYVLRYWLTEFPTLRGEDGGSAGNRVFTGEEVAVLGRIKALLYDEGYTIAGAKKKLESEPSAPARGGKRKPAAPLFEESEAAPRTSAGAAGSEEVASAAPLDTRDEQRIETLRRGLADALDEARAILELLQARR